MASSLLAIGTCGATDSASAPRGFLLSTPQIEDSLRPLKEAGNAAKKITIHAAVVGVADPLETQLGRAFDIQLSSIVRAFHVRDYVLDGFALTWNPKLASDLRSGGALPQSGTVAFHDDQRTRPSVLVFRRDVWRESEGLGANYIVLFLVGESPTFGLQPEAFRTAAKCAAALNDVSPEDDEALSMYSLSKPCIEIFDRDVRVPGVWNLEFIGPSFSGSMQSLAISLGEIYREAREACSESDPEAKQPCVRRNLNVNVISPSASVQSNVNVKNWAEALSGDAAHIRYQTLAASLEDQLIALCKMSLLDGEDVKEDARPGNNLVIFAEESSFGRGVTELVRSSDRLKKEAPGCSTRIRVRMFPQNISAIRGEQTRREEQSNADVSKLLSSRGKLLPLDLTEVGENLDRPPAYHRMLSSRSDELMLYQAFDALRVWVRPVAVAIVATDVRDRLFLLNEVRKNLPTALPVLLEMDFLTAHPDYRSVSRGSVVIPNGDTTIKLSSTTGAILNKREGRDTDYHVFPADYAANMFRAGLGLIDGFEGRPQDSPYPDDSEKVAATRPLVTTLAGFQQLRPPGCDDGGSRPCRTRSVLLAADSRISLERPFYLAFAACGVALAAIAMWLFFHGGAHLIMVSPLRNPNPWRGVTERRSKSPTDDTNAAGSAGAASSRHGSTGSSSGMRIVFGTLFLAIGVALVAFALSRLWPDIARLCPQFLESCSESRGPALRNWSLAHGRDRLALGGLALIYTAFAITGFWRLTLWRRRQKLFRSAKSAADPAFDGHDCSATKPQGAFALPALLAVLLVIWLSVSMRGLVNSVDSPWPSLVMSGLLLPIGAWFLAQFWTQARHWAELALALGGTMETVSSRVNPGKSAEELRWPSPAAIGELPQSPYSLQFRECDLDVLCSPNGDQEWQRETWRLRSGEWPFGEGRSPEFLKWQARLVAEMRYASVAVRSAAWCGVLAPTAVLIGMNVYPPFDQRLQTTISVAMIITGFLMIMYQALRLERDPLLSRMFTLHGDKLSLGGVFGALWPKLIAAAVILIPVLFPQVPATLYNMIRSVNLLQ